MAELQQVWTATHYHQMNYHSHGRLKQVQEQSQQQKLLSKHEHTSQTSTHTLVTTCTSVTKLLEQNNTCMKKEGILLST